MTRKKRYLVAGLLALGMTLLFPKQTAEAAERKTIYNSPYVTFSPDGKAFTTCAGDQDYTWYEEDTTVITGVKSSLRGLETGEHYYKVSRYDEVPIGAWKVVHRPGQCIHNSYPGTSWHGVSYGTSKCQQYYYSGWSAICADCGESVNSMLMYMSEEAAASLHYLDLGSEKQPTNYYYLCPFCNNLEQGAPFEAHKCSKISWNRYRVVYKSNTDDNYSGYMDPSFHMYNNATEYEGEAVTPVTHLTANSYDRIGYVFTGWNTEPDGSGKSFADQAEIFNLSSTDRGDKSTWTGIDDGTIILYAQWRRCESTLVIDANGGKYNGLGKYTMTEPYSSKYTLQDELIETPKGYTASFVTNGGAGVKSVTATTHFVEWARLQPFNGRILNKIYFFMAADGNVDTLQAVYQSDPITLPATSRPGWSFGGWYYDPTFSLPAGGTGDRIILSKDTTLYAQWIDLRLQSQDNYKVNGGKGAVDLSWSQADNHNKAYLVYQKRENGSWVHVNSAEDIGSTIKVNQTYTYDGSKKTYVIPSTGLYTLSAMGAQGKSYGSYTGGYGGSVSGTFWLKKGDVLTCTVGGQNGYNGGGSATAFGNGGGMTSVVSNRQGTLLIAGGGGGASPGGTGGAGGSSQSVITNSQTGERGMAGGGGGYHGGTAGEKIVHHHTDACYRDLSYSPRLGDWEYFMWSNQSGPSEGYPTSTEFSGHTRLDEDSDEPLYHLMRIGWARNSYYPYDERWNVNGYKGIATNGNTAMDISIAGDGWGEGISGGIIFSMSNYCVLDQNGAFIAQGHLDEFEAKVNDPDTQGSYEFSETIHVNLPKGTEKVFIHLQVYWNTGSAWLATRITDLKFSGAKKTICGYEEGQVISSKPAYGGSNYVNSNAILYESKSGVRSGNGTLSIQSKAVGYLDALKLEGATATDFAAPDKIAEGKVTKEVLTKGRIRVAWEIPEDNGTDYYHRVESYLAGSTSKLCDSNITKNTLVSGVRGYYYLLDQNTGTTVTNKASFVKDPHVDVTTTETVRYLHVAAVDVAGNIGATTHIRIDEKDVLWKLYTRQLEIDDSVDNVYRAAEKRFYVRADGKTSFTLKNAAYMDGTASRGYQLNENIYETITEGSSTARNIIRTPSVEITQIAGGTLRTEAAGLTYATQGITVLQQYPYSYTVRSEQGRELVGTQKFTIDRETSGKTIQVLPVAEADKGTDKIYSSYALDKGNGIWLIADGEAPVIRGMEILEHRELIDRREGSITVRVNATDEISGVDRFFVRIHNTDNAISKTYLPGEDGSIAIVLTEDDPLFSGDFTVYAYASDHVGNETDIQYGTTEFALECHVERILEPKDPVFKCGESGILTITTWGYADRVEVTFPESMTALDPSLTRVYDYKDTPGYKITEPLEFMIPLDTPENQNLEITVRAYKGDKKLEEHPAISVIGVSGTVLEELRTRLR